MDEKLVVQITAEISDLKRQVNDAKSEVESLASDSKKHSADIDETFKKAGESIKTGMKAAAVGIGAAVAGLMALVPATEEYRRNQALLASSFETVGSSAETAKATYNDLYRVLGDTGQATEAAQHLAKLTNEEKALNEWTEICQGVYATFGASLPIESLTEAANETSKTGQLTGALADALNWAGVAEDDFQAKLDACNTEAEREKLIRETLNGLYEESAAAYEKNAANILAANEAQAHLDSAMATTAEAMLPVTTMLKELGADLLEVIAPIIQNFTENHLPTIQEKLDGIGEKLKDTAEWMQKHKTLLSVLAGVIGTVVAAILLYNAVDAVQKGLKAAKIAMNLAETASIGALTAAYLSQAAAMAVALAPYVLIVAAIAAVIAIIVLCVKHWDEIKAKVKEVWDNITGKIEDAVNKVEDKMIALKEKISEKVENIKTAVQEKFEAIKTAITEKVEAAKQAVVNKFESIKSGVKDKIDNTKKNISDTFENIKSTISEKINGAKEKALSVFDNIKSGIKNKIDSARDAVKGAIDKIKGFMNFKWELPKLKMPTISVTGKFSLNPPSTPKFKINWNAKGGVFDDPTLFFGNGGLQGLGEDGAEAVVPLEKNTKWLDVIAEKLAAKQGGTLILQVDGKTLAEITCDNINHITRQKGTIPLNIY